MPQPGLIGCTSNLLVSETINGVIVHHPSRLHKRVANRRADEFESARLQILAHRIRFFTCRRNIFQRFAFVVDGLAADELPNVFVERAELLLHLDEPLRVGNRRLNFQAIADDTGVTEQASHIAFVVLGDALVVEIVQRLAKILALVQNNRPRDAGLERIENKKFKQLAVVVHWRTPFGVVVLDHLRIITGPSTTFQLSNHSCFPIIFSLRALRSLW